jgi:hypothetical protein
MFGVSESSRVTTAAESRFRIQTPQPTSRVVRVIALDGAPEREIASLIDAIPSADLIVMVVSAGGDARAAARIGKVCSDHGVMTTSIVIRAASTTDEALSKTLAQVRPWSLMVVVASDEAYVDDILRSFR